MGPAHPSLPVNASPPPQISVIVPVFRNAETLDELHRRLRQTLETQDPNFEIIFVEDGGPDRSLAWLKQLAAADLRVGLIALRQNVGQHAAILLGLGHARGSWTVIMDADLQDPPEAIPDLVATGRSGFAAVFAGRRGHYEARGRLFTSRLYRWLLWRLTGLPGDAGLFLAMDGRMRDRLLSMGGPHPSIVAMIGCSGLPLASIPVVREARLTGRSAYNSWSRLRSGLRAIHWILDWKWRKLTGGASVTREPRQAAGPAFERIGPHFDIQPETVREELQ